MMHTNGCTVLATRIPEFPDGVVGLICNALDLNVRVCVCVCARAQDGGETWVRKTASFFEFSLCLSRACLGKMIVFI
jgi:hypothetical protein